MCHKSASQIYNIMSSAGLVYESATNYNIKTQGTNFHFDSQQVAKLWQNHISWREYSTQGPARLIETEKKASFSGPRTRFKGMPSMI